MKISYAKPSITDLEISYVQDAITTGWGSKCYDYLTKFENKLSNFTGTEHVIATSSCTGAITLGLKALEIQLGRKLRVGLCDTNWVATAAPIYHAKYDMVLLDTDLTDWTVCPTDLQNNIHLIDVLVLTHLYGNVANMEQIGAICSEYGVLIIEDCAEAFGGSYNGRHVGNFGVFGVFSFHGTKTITTGEGGAFVTNDSSLYEIAFTLNNHGRRRDDKRQFFSSEAGFKFKMSNVQAAIGCAQIERATEMVQKRIDNYRVYKSLLSKTGISINPSYDDRKNVHWMINCVFQSNIELGAAIKMFNEAGIDARPFFWPLSMQKPYTKYHRDQLINSRLLQNRSINVPNYFDMTEKDISLVVKTLKKIK